MADLLAKWLNEEIKLSEVSIIHIGIRPLNTSEGARAALPLVLFLIKVSIYP